MRGSKEEALWKHDLSKGFPGWNVDSPPHGYLEGT